MNGLESKWRLAILLFLYCILTTTVRADIINNGMINNLSIENGLAGMSVSNVITDNNGQVWIATSNGINKFNGKQLKAYILPNNKIHDNFCRDIKLDKHGNLYAVTNSGVCVLKKRSEEFVPIFPELDNAETIEFLGDSIFIGNREGLFIYVKNRQKKKILVSSSSVSLDNSVRYIKMGPDGALWFTARYTINRYDLKSGKLRILKIDKAVSGLGAFAFYKNMVFIGTKNNGLLVYDIKKGKSDFIKGLGHIITTVQASGNKIYVGTDGAGAFIVNASNLTIEKHFGTNEKDRAYLPDDAVYCYYHDRNGVDWFGFYRYGLCYYFHSEPLFTTYKYRDFTTKGLDVRSYLINGNVRIVGTSSGFYYIDEGKDVVRYFSPERIGAHIITTIAYYNGNYYIGAYDGGVMMLNPNTFEIKRPSGNPKFSYSSFARLALSPDNKLWMMGGEGLFVLDSRGNIANYTEDNSQIRGGLITSAVFDRNDNAWISCADGISMYLGSQGIFKSNNFPDGFFNNELNLTIVKGHKDFIYAYKRTSVFFTNLQMTRFGKIEVPDMILSERCVDFLDNQKGHFWIATEKGLFRTDYNMKNIQHFGYGEGLSSSLISSQSLSYDNNGFLWFATANGLMKVNPKNLIEWQSNEHYKIIPYHILIGGDNASADKENMMVNDKSVYLGWNILSQELRFIPILEDFARPDGRFYQYRIDNKEWILTKDGEEIAINNLSIGKHTLHVRLSGASGTESIYGLYVFPSFLAYFELVAIIIMLSISLWWRRYHKRTIALLAERDTIEQALIEEEQARQSVEMKQQIGEMASDEMKSDKYRKVKYDEGEFESIKMRMDEYMTSERPYLSQELKMSELARALNVSSSKLSQVFTMYLKENYYEYINSFRMKEFMKLIDNGEYKRYTLTALSEKCGFKKTSFFSTFRKMESCTPTEYLQKLGVKEVKA